MRCIASLLLMTASCLHASEAATVKSIPTSAYFQRIAHERLLTARQLQEPDGWLSVVALREILPGTISVGSAADSDIQLSHGIEHALTLRLTGNVVNIVSSALSMTLNGEPVMRAQAVQPSDDPAETFRWDSFMASVIIREGHYYIRIRDTQAPSLQQFHAPSYYPVKLRYRVVAAWIPYKTPHTITMATETGQMLILPAPGYALVKMGGVTARLEAFELMGGRVAFLFHDPTNETTTYGGGRELFADSPSNGLQRRGQIVLDFNETSNPACAYTPYGTCPSPPPQNRIRVPIPAGEKRYHD